MRTFRPLGILTVLVLAGCSQPAGPEAIPPTSSAPSAMPPAWQSPDFQTESYDHIEEADFLSVATSPFSTFSIDVDTGSYANVRRFLTQQPGRKQWYGAPRRAFLRTGSGIAAALLALNEVVGHCYDVQADEVKDQNAFR